MKKLSSHAFARAREYLYQHARPLERALFRHEFESGPPGAVLEALSEFQNPDGGFGGAIEPDLRLPESSGLATLTGLDALREIDASADTPAVRRAIAWVVDRYDPALPGWRSVPDSVDQHPHAPHWNWELHGPGGPWPHILIPGARLLSHLQHWRTLAPAALVEEFSRAFRAHVVELTESGGGDSLYYASTVDDPAIAEPLRALARSSVNTNPAEWKDYVTKPLKLAPLPTSLFAETLAEAVSANLDWEIEQQSPDGAWEPNWSWRGSYPADWEIARREWRGELTRRVLRSLRAFGRIEGA